MPSRTYFFNFCKDDPWSKKWFYWISINVITKIFYIPNHSIFNYILFSTQNRYPEYEKEILNIIRAFYFIITIIINNNSICENH